MANFQLKYYSKVLVIFPMLGFLFTRAFDGFTRLILHIYANEEILWNGFAILSNPAWIGILWLVHIATSFLVGMVLMTLTNRSKYVIYIFASTITLHGVFNWCRLFRANDEFAIHYLNLENSWSFDLFPVFIHIVMGLIGCLLSYNFSKTQVKPTS